MVDMEDDVVIEGLDLLTTAFADVVATSTK